MAIVYLCVDIFIVWAMHYDIRTKKTMGVSYFIATLSRYSKNICLVNK